MKECLECENANNCSKCKDEKAKLNKEARCECPCGKGLFRNNQNYNGVMYWLYF